MDDKVKRDIILDNYQNPINRGLIKDDSYITINTSTESCIDDIDLAIKLKDDIIEDIRFDGEACAITTSTTSIMIKLLLGKKIKEALNIIDNYQRMINEKDYNEEETRRGLWHHTMAGGIGAIWGNLDSTGIYANKDELKCFSVFWNDHKRFRKDMVIDNSLTNGYCLKEGDKYYVFYKEDTNELTYSFSGKSKKVVAVDTKKEYHEIDLGVKKAGSYTFPAPYLSDWAIAVEGK